MTFKIIIPARYNASRLPGKVLLPIADKPMLQHVYERAIQSGAESVYIATDDQRIREAAEKFGAHVCMTSPQHLNGTDRIAEAAVALGCLEEEIIVNIQADEPLIPPSVIRQVAEDLQKHPKASIASLYEPIHSIETLFDTNKVKVVMDKYAYALYFSRAPIPWDRDDFTLPVNPNQTLKNQYFRHIGIYAYRAHVLEKYSDWPVSPLEKIEKLEQLRVLWNGGHIHLTQSELAIPGDVNTEGDLKLVRDLLMAST